MDEYVDRAETMYKPFIKEGQLCFDIGAHVGTRVCVFLNLGARVVAVEPYSKLATFISKNFQKFVDSGELVVLRSAVSDCQGTATLKIAPKNTTICTISENFAASITKHFGWEASRVYTDSEEVSVITLDHLVTTYGIPEFLKVDTEGLDSCVLRTLRNPVKIVSFEYNQSFLEIARECVQKLCTLGEYRFNYEREDRLVLESSSFLKPETLLEILPSLTPTGKVYGDVLAVRCDVLCDLESR